MTQGKKAAIDGDGGGRGKREWRTTTGEAKTAEADATTQQCASRPPLQEGDVVVLGARGRQRQMTDCAARRAAPLSPTAPRAPGALFLFRGRVARTKPFSLR